MIDLNKPDYYFGQTEQNRIRTRRRLEEINELGLKEVGYGEFGMHNVMSGLYIERVWNFSNAHWTDYVDWIKEVKLKKTS